MFRRRGILLAILSNSVAAVLLGPATADNTRVVGDCATLQETEKAMPSPSTPSSIANTARNPEIAVCEEFAIAEQTGTMEAYQFFIARHPDHPLATLARARVVGLTEVD